MPTLGIAAMMTKEMNNTDARLWHPWLPGSHPQPRCPCD